MILNMKARLMLAGAVFGVSVLTLAVADAQINPSTGAPTTQPELSPSTGGTTTPQPYDMGTDAGVGGAGSTGTYTSPFSTTDAGFGGSGVLPPSTLGGDMLDAGLR